MSSLFLKPITNMRGNSLFGGYCPLQQIINCSAISLAVWNPELKKLYDRNVAVSYQTLLSVNLREELGTRLRSALMARGYTTLNR